MNSTDDPPSYEESNDQYKIDSTKINKQTFTFTKGPDFECAGHHSLMADFIPWNDNGSCEDLGYLLLRANNWLQDNPYYEVKKCEILQRMINSQRKLEISNCYIFNMTFGRRYFINQLRMHIYINKAKMEADQICLKTIIPDLIRKPQRIFNNFMILPLRSLNILPKFEEASNLLLQLNNNFQDSTITGRIVNISTFYLNIVQFLSNFEIPLTDNVLFYEEADQGKCHLKCLRIFYKPGIKINATIDVKTFSAAEKSVNTLGDLTNSALNWINKENERSFVSFETFSEYSVKENVGPQKLEDNSQSAFIFFAKSSTLIRKEVINVFHFTDNEILFKNIPCTITCSEIVWITPRKEKNIYETYYSFMNYVRFVFVKYEEQIIDAESIMIQNPLSWSNIRFNSLERFYSENNTNYQIFTIRLIVKAGTIMLPLKGAPVPYISSTKYSTVCNLF